MIFHSNALCALILYLYLSSVYHNAYNNRKLYTNPINPDTSTNENPINAHLIKLLLIDGLREIEKTKNANIRPTPIATPVKHIIGILEARYLKPINIINCLVII